MKKYPLLNCLVCASPFKSFLPSGVMSDSYTMSTTGIIDTGNLNIDGPGAVGLFTATSLSIIVVDV